MNPRIPAAAAAVCGLCGLAAYAFSERLKIVHYTVKNRNAGGRTRFLHVSDLHGSDFGEELYRRTDELSPDAVMMTGDIADNRIPNEKGFALTEYIGKRFPAFYVSGNHEIYTHDADGIKNRLRSQGITVLEGEGTMLTAGGSSFLICGIDDPYGFPDRKGRLWEDQLSDCAALCRNGIFSVLLTHRPEMVKYYRETGFDLVLAGHAHGGQVMIPGLLNGLYAPHQGLFPEYAGGRFVFPGSPCQTLIVSRGLSKYVRPRVFNRPELVVIDIEPDNDAV